VSALLIGGRQQSSLDDRESPRAARSFSTRTGGRASGARHKVEAIEGLSEAAVLVSPEENRALTMTLWVSEHAMREVASWPVK
jgi:hypothetical protein